MPSLMELTNLLSRLRVISWSSSRETPLNSDLDRDRKIPTSLFMFMLLVTETDSDSDYCELTLL